jgi:NADP-dependent aldehyde dehydrogenase
MSGVEQPTTSPAEFEQVLESAAAAAPALGAMSPGERARLLRAIATGLRARRDELVPLADADSALGEARLAGEVERTAVQFEMFAGAVEEGSWLEAVIDRANPEGPLGPQPDLRRMLVPLGPVAVFGASNFPFAFGLAGGDTASALAAGCPVVAKAHPAQPRFSGPYANVVAKSLAAAGAPEGTFGVVSGLESGRALVMDPRITAVGFTGSTSGGRALADLAAARPSPVPFYGELGSLNPVFVTPAAAAVRGEEIVRDYLASVALGAGQFCTKPGLLVVPEDSGMAEIVAGEANTAPVTLLHDGIGDAYLNGTRALATHPAVRTLAGAPEGDGRTVRPVLATTTIAELAEFRDELLAERFGPFSLVVTYRDADELLTAVALLEGSLTSGVHAEGPDDADAAALLPLLASLAGRVLWNGWPTGVAVTWAQHHGGPHPSTTSIHTSVGVTAMRRFLRPIAYQSLPDPLLPAALADANPLGIPRRVDGVLTSASVA